jgi:hypothetical protein
MEKMIKEKELTGYCGLYCGDCIRYQSRASELADELLDEIDKNNFTEYAKIKGAHKKEFENFESFISLLKAISEINCEIPCGLGGDGCGGTCEIIKCVKARGFLGCWECNDFEECDKFDFLKPFHGDAPLKNLRIIKELGIDNWAKHREKCYPWL